MNEIEKRLKELEDNKEISPRTKKAMKEKARIEEFLRKVDIIMKQKQVKNRMVSLESSQINHT